MTDASRAAVVAERLGLAWQVHADPFGLGLDGLAGLAVRDNPRRAHLVVSPVLAKHVPVRPSVAAERARQLAGLVGVPDPLVLGFCETATGLGHAVADALPGADYVHTTRRPDPARVTLAGFDEEHSHAVAHHLQPPPGLVDPERALVLVDDELTTGTTALNTVAALGVRGPVVLAALLDLRSAAARSAFDERAAALGVEVRTVALLDGELALPHDVLARGRALQDELRALPDPAPPPATGEVRVVRAGWPADVPTGGRHGFLTGDRDGFDRALRALELDVTGPVLVVGTEELMHLPNRLALLLEQRGVDVRVQSTTRSPVLPLDVDGYAIRTRLSFPSTDGSGRSTFLYNVTEPVTDVVVVTEDDVEAARPLAAQLRPFATGTVHLLGLT